MDREDLAWLRLRRQRLIGPPLATPEAVVGWLGAVQAQELAVARWSVARRARGRITAAHMDRALAEGRILRTHLLRPTWHFVLPTDIRWMLALTAPRVHGLSAYYSRQLGITASHVARSQRLLGKVLAGGQSWTRDQIFALFAREGVGDHRLALGMLLMQAELDQVICSGVPRLRTSAGARTVGATAQTYALLDERAPSAPARTRDQALAELAVRYFRSHGPATLKDFLWWSSLPAADARRGLELAGSQLRELRVDGRIYYSDAAPVRGGPAAAGPTVQLLQAYDEYLVAYTESKSVFGGGGPPVRSLLLHAVVRDGTVIGRWRRQPGATERIEVRVDRRLDRAGRAALEAEVQAYARFIERPVTLAVDRPAVARST